MIIDQEDGQIFREMDRSSGISVKRLSGNVIPVPILQLFLAMFEVE